MGNQFRVFVRGFATGAVAALVAAAIIFAWVSFKPSAPAAVAEPAKEVVGEPTHRLDCKPVVVYRDRVEKKLGLPAAVRSDTAKHVVAAVKIPGSDSPHTATAVYAEDTGKVDMFVRRDPRPWLAFDRRWTVGIFYGMSNTTNDATLELTGAYSLMRIKAAHIGPMGRVNLDGDGFAGIGIWASGH